MPRTSDIGPIIGIILARLAGESEVISAPPALRGERSAPSILRGYPESRLAACNENAIGRMACTYPWTPNTAPGPLGGSNRMQVGPGADPTEFYIKKILIYPVPLHIAHCTVARNGGLRPGAIHRANHAQASIPCRSGTLGGTTKPAMALKVPQNALW